jgi:response regulator RpfG family c-di-GMP phosphodiesterase
MSMPGKDGFDMLAALAADEATRDLPVVILTGQQDRALKRRALEEGAADLLTKPADAEELIARIRSVLRLKASQDDLKAANRTLEEKVARRTEQLERAHLDAVWRLAKAGEFRDEETGAHVARVGCISRTVAEGLGLDRPSTERLFLTAPLHDIGKIGVPGEVLLKRGRLSTEERRIMERHCVIGSEVLLSEPQGMRAFLEWKGFGPVAAETPPSGHLDMAATIALGHHERWDGQGYPRGLAGEAIPIEARIVALADVYDALRSDRPYKVGYTQERTMAIMRDEAGTRFDPDAFAAFEAAMDEIQEIVSRFADGALAERDTVASRAPAAAFAEGGDATP